MTDKRAEMASSILNAIILTNESPDGSVYIDPDHAQEAMVMAMAAMIEGRPDIKDAVDLKRHVETLALEIMDKAAAMRAAYERTGRRLWDADVIRPN